MRKILLILFASFFLMSCAPTVEEPPPKANPIDISFLHYFSDPLSGGINEMVTVFNEGQTEYTLRAVPLDHEAFKLSMVADLKSQNPPEVYSYWAGARVNAVYLDLEPIDQLWEENNLDQAFSPSIIESAVTYNGQKYLVPITQHFVVMFYNKKVFDTLKITPPHTWDEFVLVGEKVKAAGLTPIALGSKNKWPEQFWFDYLLLRTAGMDYRNRLMNGRARYTDPEVERVFALLAPLVEKGYFTEHPENYDFSEAPMVSFANGESAMMLMGSWNLGILGNAPYDLIAEKDYDYFEFPIVDKDMPPIALGPIDGLVVPKNSRYKEGGKAVLTFMASVEAQMVMSIGSGALSPNTQIDAGFYTPIQVRMAQDVSESSGWAFNYDLATPPEIAAVGLDLFNDFWTFPKDYIFLLKEADKKIESIWDTLGRD